MASIIASVPVEGVSSKLICLGGRRSLSCSILRNNAGNYVVIRTETPAAFLQRSVTFAGSQFSGLRRD